MSTENPTDPTGSDNPEGTHQNESEEKSNPWAVLYSQKKPSDAPDGKETMIRHFPTLEGIPEELHPFMWEQERGGFVFSHEKHDEHMDFNKMKNNNRDMHATLRDHKDAFGGLSIAEVKKVLSASSKSEANDPAIQLLRDELSLKSKEIETFRSERTQDNFRKKVIESAEGMIKPEAIDFIVHKMTQNYSLDEDGNLLMADGITSADQSDLVRWHNNMKSNDGAIYYKGNTPNEKVGKGATPTPTQGIIYADSQDDLAELYVKHGPDILAKKIRIVRNYTS